MCKMTIPPGRDITITSVATGGHFQLLIIEANGIKIQKYYLGYQIGQLPLLISLIIG